MAKATGALAPAGGVDCNGDPRTIEIQPHDALVCGESEGLDTTLLNILASLSDRATISLVAPKGPTLTSVSRTSFPIDAKKETTRTFTVRYSCVNVLPGQYVNNLEAGLRGLSIAKATATVYCGGDTTPRTPRARLNVPGAQGEPPNNPTFPGPNPPLPVPAPVQPISQPQVQTQTQAQANPQAGMADQEQEQLQVATATNTLEGGRQDDDELAMSALDYSRTAPQPYYVLLTGLGMAAATGVALRRRTRTQVARQRTR
jgi:hypothetical protein